MAISLNSLLNPLYIRGLISQFRMPQSHLADLFGWSVNKLTHEPTPGQTEVFSGPNVENSELTEGLYDIYDGTARLARSVGLTAPASRRAPHPTGKVPYYIPRQSDSVFLEGNRLFQMRQQGSVGLQVANGAEVYILRQLKTLTEYYANFIEFQTAAMLRGSYVQIPVDDRWENVFSSTAAGARTINYQIAANNKSQLNMGTGSNIIGASWATTSTDIPKHVREVSAAFTLLVGRGLTDIVIPPAVWSYVVQNDEVQSQGGTAQRAWFEKSMSEDRNYRTFELLCLPGITWHVIPTAFELYDPDTGTYGTTKTAAIPATSAMFIAGPANEIASYLVAPEAYTTRQASGYSFDQRYGFFTYPKHEQNPAGVDVIATLLGVPMLKIPNAIANGTVVF